MNPSSSTSSLQRVFATVALFLLPFPALNFGVSFTFADVFLVTGAIMLGLKSFQAEEDDEPGEAVQERQAATSDESAGPGGLTTPASSPGTTPPDPLGSPPEEPAS